MSDVDRKQRELYTRQQQLLREQRTADQERLLATVSGLSPYTGLEQALDVSSSNKATLQSYSNLFSYT